MVQGPGARINFLVIKSHTTDTRSCLERLVVFYKLGKIRIYLCRNLFQLYTITTFKKFKSYIFKANNKNCLF